MPSVATLRLIRANNNSSSEVYRYDETSGLLSAPIVQPLRILPRTGSDSLPTCTTNSPVEVVRSLRVMVSSLPGERRPKRRGGQCVVSSVLLDRVCTAEIFVSGRRFDQAAVVMPEDLQIVLRELLDGYQAIAGPAVCRDQLVQLQVNGERILVLRALNQEDHQKGDDGRAGVDHQLPIFAVTEQRSEHRPDDHRQRGEKERRRAAAEIGDCTGEPFGQVARARGLLGQLIAKRGQRAHATGRAFAAFWLHSPISD